MENLRDYRAHEEQCRKRALTDEEHKEMWLSMAERWSSLAHREAAFHFRVDLARAAGH